jgi:hypothetical protein
MSRWKEKQAMKAEFEFVKALDKDDGADSEALAAADCRDAAMGKGEGELFEKKLSKEERKALQKQKRDAKKTKKVRGFLVLSLSLSFSLYIYIYIYGWIYLFLSVLACLVWSRMWVH